MNDSKYDTVPQQQPNHAQHGSGCPLLCFLSSHVCKTLTLKYGVFLTPYRSHYITLSHLSGCLGFTGSQVFAQNTYCLISNSITCDLRNRATGTDHYLLCHPSFSLQQLSVYVLLKWKNNNSFMKFYWSLLSLRVKNIHLSAANSIIICTACNLNVFS